MTPRLDDRWLRLAGIPLLAVLGNFIFYQPDNDSHNINRLTALGLSLAETMLVWEVGRPGILLARRYYPRLNQTQPRIVLQVAWLISMTAVQRLLITYVYDRTQFWGYPISERGYWVNTLVPMLFLVPFAAIYEARYLYRQWWSTYYEAEKLKKENLKSQLQALRQQINPHFLFNSLSTLSSLVTENPARAEHFIEELASVYRYVLQTSSDTDQELTLVTLADELGFIDAYYHLLQTRFGDGVSLTIDVDDGYQNWQMPPLTLQLLVENAVKHNVANVRRPLYIRLYTDPPGNLCVENKYQPKPSNAVVSGGKGLKNITTKYRLLRQPAVVIQQTDETFLVSIPLIKPTATHEHTDR